MTEHGSTAKRYGLLRFIAGALKVLAWVALVGSGLFALGVLASAAGADLPQLREAGLAGFFLFLVYGIGSFILLYVSGEATLVFLDAADDLRGIRERLDTALRERAPAAAPPAAPERVVHVPTSAEPASVAGPITVGAAGASPPAARDEPRAP